MRDDRGRWSEGCLSPGYRSVTRSSVGRGPRSLALAAADRARHLCLGAEAARAEAWPGAALRSCWRWASSGRFWAGGGRTDDAQAAGPAAAEKVGGAAWVAQDLTSQPSDRDAEPKRPHGCSLLSRMRWDPTKLASSTAASTSDRSRNWRIARPCLGTGWCRSAPPARSGSRDRLSLSSQPVPKLWSQERSG